MARFEVAILNDKLIKPPTRDQMWTPSSPAMEERYYGLGWGDSDENGVTGFSHTGGQQGTSTAFMSRLPSVSAWSC